MKANRLSKLLCLVIGLVMLLSAMPIAAYIPLTTGSVKATQAVSDGHIDAVLRDFGTPGQKPDVSAHVTDAVSFTFDKNARVKSDGANNVLGLAADATKTGLTINDLKGDSLMNGFVYSADYYFGDDYITGVADSESITGAADSEITSCVQLLEFQTGFQKIVRLGHDGRIFVTLASGNPVIPGVKISANDWFNFKVEMLPQGANATRFTYYIYVDNVLVYTADLVKNATQTPISYRVLAADKVVGNACMIDNVMFRTLPIIPDPDRVDTTIDFENLSATEFKANTWINATNLASYLNTSNTAVHTSWEGNTTMNSSIITSGTPTYNRVWQNASAKAHFAVEDVEKRLVARDFTVSADMMFSAFPTDKTSLIRWLRGSATLSGSRPTEFLYIDSNGNFCQNGVELGAKAELNEWFNVTLKVSYVSHGLYNVATYINEELISVNDITVASTNYSTDKSFICFYSTANAAFKACLDNVQIYESDNVKIVEENDVLWDLNFNGLADNTQPNLSILRSFSNGYEAVRNNMGNAAVVSNERLKISAAFNKWIDLKLGEGTYDPVKEGPVSISFKFNLESKTTVSDAMIRIIGIRRAAGIPESANGKTVDAVYILNNDLYFFDTKVMTSIELNKDYDIKVVLDGRRNVASLYIGNNKIVDSLSIAHKNAGAGIVGEGLSFVTDDAGNKYNLPHTGFVYQQKYDKNGEAIANTYVKRFVQTTGYRVDMLRLFQVTTADPTGLVYYVDDLKVEKLERDNSFVGTDFTGWYNLKDHNPGTTSQKVFGYFNFVDSPVIKVESETGNEYLYGSAAKRMFINDPFNLLKNKTFEINFDLKYLRENVSRESVTSFLSIVSSATAHEPYVTDMVNSNNKYDHLLYTDADGKLYDFNKSEIYSSLDDGWTNIRIIVETDGNMWNTFSYYVKGKYIGTVTVGASNVNNDTATNSSIRFVTQGTFSMGLDNVKISFPTPSVETYDFNLDFDGDYEAMLTAIGSDNKYPSVGASRTDANGGTVVSAQVLGDTDKFLRIDRTLLAADQTGYINASNAKYIGEKEYIVETDFRFSCDAGFGITPVTIIGEKSETQFVPVEVVGAKNTLNMNMRGARYDLYNAAGTLLKVKTTEDEGFTKLAILVNENDLTYTVYVDGKVAYYYYDGEYLPCVNIPMIFSETGVSTSNGSMLKLMAIDGIRHNYSIIDIDKITITPVPSSFASEFKATQSRVNTEAQTFDIRFIAGLDSLYGNKVGFVIKTIYTDGDKKTVEEEFTSNTVFSAIKNEDEMIEASEFGCKYLSALSVTDLPINVGEVNLEVTQFVEYGGVRVLGETETLSVIYSDGKVIVK